ncbi:MAG: hypothetical protein MJ247_00150 [Alphaproteobacteria bacterium]|nr:hypothetical protein [Alphaproteobacteria bacterium]
MSILLKSLFLILSFCVYKSSIAYAFDENEYRLIDLRKRAYNVSSVIEIQKNSQQSGGGGLISENPEKNNYPNQQNNMQPQPNYSSQEQIMIKKGPTATQRVDEHKQERANKQDTIIENSPNNDTEIKEYIKNNPKVLPDV